MAEPCFDTELCKKPDSVANANQNSDVNQTGLSLPAPAYGLDMASSESKMSKEDQKVMDSANLIGNYTDPYRILIPAGISTEMRWQYFSSILPKGAPALDSKPGGFNIIALRGVVIDKLGNIKQTSSSRQFKQAMHDHEKLKEQHHFSDSKTARESTGRQKDTKDSKGGGTWNDILVSLWVDKEGKKNVSVKRGSVDPARTGNVKGAAHLRDGSYKYGIGSHGTAISDHKKLAKQLETDKRFKVRIQKRKGKTDKRRYMALVPRSDLDVFRDDSAALKKNKKDLAAYENQPESKGFFTPSNIKKHDKNKKRDPRTYTNPRSVGTNIHLGGYDESYSEGCINMPKEEFVQLMDEVFAAQKLSKKSAGRFTFNFTLLDASKVGLQIVKTQRADSHDSEEANSESQNTEEQIINSIDDDGMQHIIERFIGGGGVVA